MKKSKIFMAAGAIVLTISAVFATKANKKFLGQTTGYAASGSGLNVKFSSPTLYTTTTHVSTPAIVTLLTGTGAHFILRTQLRTSSLTGAKLLYY
jgi:hypothetical protein